MPEKMKIWLNAPTEALGGILKKEIKINNLFEDFETLRSWLNEKFYQEEWFSSIIVFEGLWEYDGVKLSGFFSINNEYAWQQAYQDVEIDAYGRGEISDLIDVFWKKGEIEFFASSFFTELKSVQEDTMIKPSEMYFSIGAPEYGEMDNLRALHLKDWRDFVDFMYSKLRKDAENWVVEKVAPIDRHFFLGSIKEEKIAQTLFKKGLEKSLLIEKTGQSSTFIAKNQDSFTKFYHAFKEEVFKSAAQELPEAKMLKRNIREGLEKEAGTSQLTFP